MKICISCSHGGHLTEALQILESYEGHDYFIVTYHSSRDKDVEQIVPAYFLENINTNVWRMFKAFIWTFQLLRREKPDVVISHGAEIAIPFLYLGKLLRKKTIYIECWCRVENLSLTGRLVYPVVDLFLVQWPQLVSHAGSKAQYRGAVA